MTSWSWYFYIVTVDTQQLITELIYSSCPILFSCHTDILQNQPIFIITTGSKDFMDHDDIDDYAGDGLVAGEHAKRPRPRKHKVKKPVR